MKKILTFMFAAALLASCQQEENEISDPIAEKKEHGRDQTAQCPDEQSRIACSE